MLAMEDARPYLNKYLSADDYSAISQLVSAGYAACVSATHDHPVLGKFLPAILLRSWLITPFVDAGLINLKGFTYSFRPNAARNWYQTTLYKGGLALTSHFLGAGKKNRRKAARQAVVRAELNQRNYDLFTFESTTPDLRGDFLYCHILHGGFSKADTICLAIPNRDQDGYCASTVLELVEPEQVQVEEIREEIIVQLIKLAETGGIESSD